jgi:hypothetical protein
VIRNVAIHSLNEQPLLADLFDLPAATDAGLMCTNLRGMDGKRPVFIDGIESVFFFPYRVIRFLEIPPVSIQRHRAEGGRMDAGAASSWAAGALEPEPVLNLPAGAAGTEAESLEGSDLGEEIDEDFLRRIRDI